MFEKFKLPSRAEISAFIRGAIKAPGGKPLRHTGRKNSPDSLAKSESHATHEAPLSSKAAYIARDALALIGVHLDISGELNPAAEAAVKAMSQSEIDRVLIEAGCGEFVEVRKLKAEIAAINAETAALKAASESMHAQLGVMCQRLGLKLKDIEGKSATAVSEMIKTRMDLEAAELVACMGFPVFCRSNQN